MRIDPETVLLPLQVVAAMVALVSLALWPPAAGRMLLVPLTGAAASGVARAALAGGATLLGSGPFPGSLVVLGSQADITRRIGGWSIVIMAAPDVVCGAAARADGSS